MRYVLGIDFGGGASKATLLGKDGIIYAEANYEYSTLYPAPGHVEQDPSSWYEATRENIASIIRQSGVSPHDIVAVSLDAATHTAVVMDEDFHVLRPAIYWTDTRTQAEVAALKEAHGDQILKAALHHVDTIWTLPQLLWIKHSEPDIFAKIKRVCFAKDYVRHQLTGDYVTDFIEAEGSMLFDYHAMAWSEELCSLCGLDRAMLPKVVRPEDVAGTVTAKAADETGLAEGTVVLCGTTDTVMEVFAAGAVEKGQMTVKIATAGRICIVTDKPYPHTHLINYSHVVPNLWYPGTATKSCAASYRWYRDTFGGDYRALDEGASQIPPGAEGLMFHPYLNGELTPYADPLLCASFIGVRAGHTKAHFTRAVLEGAAMSLLDCQKALEAIGLPHDAEAVIIGGGGKSPLWRKITADMLGITLVQKRYADSSFGSAVFAGLAAGFWKTPKQALGESNEVVSRTEPDAATHELYGERYKTYRAVHDALAPLYRP